MPGNPPAQSPTQYTFNRHGFQPLGKARGNTDHNMDIPLQQVVSHSSTGARRLGDNTAPQTDYTNGAGNEKAGGFLSRHGFAGRRRLKSADVQPKGGVGLKSPEDEEVLTKMGRLYKKVLDFSIVTRYFLYVLPLALIIAIPIIIAATGGLDSKVGATPVEWFSLWLEIVWLSLWVSKIVAHFLPKIFQFLMGVVSSGTRKYALVIRNLERPLALVGWAATCLATFLPLMQQTPGSHPEAVDQNPIVTAHWEDVVSKVLAAAFISTIIFTVEKLFVQVISINYHRTQFEGRIKENKRHIHLLSLLYDASRALFPMYCPEFEEEDYLITDSVEFSMGSRTPTGRPKTANPVRFVRNIGRFGDQITAVFGNVAQEITGKEVFRPDSAHSIVVEALEKTRSSEALARRLWMSFVVEGRDSLLKEDIVEVLGDGRQEEAEECFHEMDKDANGDISLDEMVLMVTQWGRDRKSTASSMHDVDQAINVLDSLLTVIVSIIIVFIFVAFLNANFTTTLATTGTALLSLSFVFAATAQEFLGSCIFLFSKHPFDVGDRIDLGTEQLTVESISLLFTVFRRVANNKIVQIPNQALNALWVENVSRSKAMHESISLFVSYDTSFEDIQLLRREMEAFARDKDNSRDFFPDLDIDVVSVAELDKLELSVSLRTKSNWSNGSLQAARRSKFFCALVLALRKVPIFGPGGGLAILGDKARPNYSVAVSETDAQKAADQFAAEQDAARLVPAAARREIESASAPPQSGDTKDGSDGGTGTTQPRGHSTGVDYLGATTSATEATAVSNLTLRSPAVDISRDDVEPAPRTPTGARRSTDASGGARPSLDSIACNPNNPPGTSSNANLLRRASSKGKRRATSSDYPGVPTIVEPTGASGEGDADEIPSWERHKQFGSNYPPPAPPSPQYSQYPTSHAPPQQRQPPPQQQQQPQQPQQPQRGQQAAQQQQQEQGELLQQRFYDQYQPYGGAPAPPYQANENEGAFPQPPSQGGGPPPAGQQQGQYPPRTTSSSQQVPPLRVQPRIPRPPPK